MSKYNARRVEIDGHRFASAAEGRRYATLAALERAGRIAGLELQPRFTELAGVDTTPIREIAAHLAGGVAVAA
jgi:hypothetical protein